MGGSLPDDGELHRACAAGCLTDVKVLLAQGHNAQEKDEWGRGLLHVAVEHGAMDLIEYLVDDMALGVLDVDQFGESLLHVAVRRGDLSIIKYLVTKGANSAPLLKCPHRSSMGHSGQKYDNCPEDVVVLAARHASMQVLEYLVAVGFPVDPQNKHQRPLMAAAITRGDVKMMELFTRSGFSLSATDAIGTPMMALAAKHGNADVLDYFIHQGVWENGYTLLRAAVEGDRLENLKSLVALRLDLHGTDRFGKTLLHVAVETASRPVIEYLLAKQVDVHAVTTHGKTLLHCAVERGDLEILQFLLSEGVLQIDDAVHVDESVLQLAVRSDNVELVKFLIDKGVLGLAAVDKNGYSLLHLAVWRDNLKMIQYLETKGLRADQCDSTEKSLLRLAVAHASLLVIQHLVSKGLSVHTANTSKAFVIMDADDFDLHEDELFKKSLRRKVTEVDSVGTLHSSFSPSLVLFVPLTMGDFRFVVQGHFSLLHVAAQRGDLPVVQYLVGKGLDIHAIDKLGRSLLHIATISDNHDVAEYAVGLGVEMNSVDKKGKTALHHAVRQGNMKLLALFVSHNMDLKAIDAAGPSLLPKAVKRCHWLTIEYLLQNGLHLDAVDKICGLDQDGKSLLHVAAVSGSKRMIELLLAKGMTLNKQVGAELLFIAVENQDLELLAYLMDKKLDPHAIVNRHGSSLLHVALRQHVPCDGVNLKMVSYLCAKTDGVAAIDKRGNTPLHVACELGDTESVKLLLENGASATIAITNNDGLQPLHIAAREWHTTLVRVLLEAGATANAQSFIAGLTPLGAALTAETLPTHAHELEELYGTARLLCKHGATWSPDCEVALTEWPAQMETQLARQWSKESSMSSGQESDFGSYSYSTSCDGLEPQDQLAMFEQDLHHALAVRRGIRLCVSYWMQELQVTNSQPEIQGEDANVPIVLSKVLCEVLFRGEQAVATYLNALATTSADQLQYRRKICVTGPTQSGKTSLVRSLLASQPQLVPSGDRTVGIDLFSYSFVEESATSIRCHDVSFWDFAGQDVYHGIHTLFFSRQTLYFICVDLSAYADALKHAEHGTLSAMTTTTERQREATLSRFVERSVFKWLRLIFARQPDADVAIVGTKVDLLHGDRALLGGIQRDFQLRLSTWKRKLESEIDTAFASAATLSGRSSTNSRAVQLKDQIAKLLSREWLVVSSASDEAVDQARMALESTIAASDNAFVMPSTYARALKTIQRRREAATQRLDGKERIESVVVPVHALCKLLLREVSGLLNSTESCLAILRTLHDLGELLWYEDASVGALQDIVILDPVLVMDLVREVVNYERVDVSSSGSVPVTAADAMTISADGRVPHTLLCKSHLWRHMDRELMYAFKSLLQFYQVVYSSDGRTMDWESDLIVPTYWKTQRDAVHALPLLQQQSSMQRRGVTASIYLSWEYDLPSEISELLFEQLAVESHSPLLQRSAAWHNCIESTIEGEFASRLELHQRETQSTDVIRLEVAASEETVAWRYLRFYVMAMETVLDRYPGLVVSRYIVDTTTSSTETRHRVDTAVRSMGVALRMGDHDDARIRDVIPWMPPDFSWFTEQAWKEPGILQRLRTRELVRQAVDKVDVLRQLVVTGTDARRRLPALWTCELQKEKQKIILKLLSDLSGLCFHVPIEIDVPASFLAKYGSWLENGLSICSNVVPKALSLGVLQKVFDVAQAALTRTVARATQVHNLIDQIDFPATTTASTTAAANTTALFASGSNRKLPPAIAMRMLRDLLTLHDALFDDHKITTVSNLECAATTTSEGHFVWAHRHEILSLKGLVELCEPDAGVVSLPVSVALKQQQQASICIRISSIQGLVPWNWRLVFCEWQLFYGERQTPIDSGRTPRHDDDSATAPSWDMTAFQLKSVMSMGMLRECRLVVHVKRPSRLLGTIKTLHDGSVRLEDVVASDVSLPFKDDAVVVPLDDVTPSLRFVVCQLEAV